MRIKRCNFFSTFFKKEKMPLFLFLQERKRQHVSNRTYSFNRKFRISGRTRYSLYCLLCKDAGCVVSFVIIQILGKSVPVSNGRQMTYWKKHSNIENFGEKRWADCEWRRTIASVGLLDRSFPESQSCRGEHHLRYVRKTFYSGRTFFLANFKS